MVIIDDPPEVSDQMNLLSRASAGDAQAFCLLTEPLQTRLLRQAAALSGDLHLAEDLVSETLVEAWKCLPRFNHTCRLSTWLYAILLNRHRQSVRRARSRPLSLAWLPFFQAQDACDLQAKMPAPGASPAASLEQSESTAQLRRCIDQLPEKHRQVILLRFYENASLPDIAAVLGCSAGTVKSRLHHGLEKLRKMKMNLPDRKGDQSI